MPNIKERYSDEINDITYILRNLENGRYTEKSKANYDGYLNTNIAKLQVKFFDLLDKIENDKPSNIEEIGEAFKNSKL